MLAQASAPISSQGVTLVGLGGEDRNVTAHAGRMCRRQECQFHRGGAPAPAPDRHHAGGAPAPGARET
eukprot:8122926-Pyramimonas_sp.AAC.1